MALTQKYGIAYPFKNDNKENVFIDTNPTEAEGIKSQVLHVIFTPKGQKLRDPEFGTDLIKYIFTPSDGSTFNDIKTEISQQILKYVPSVEFKDITVYKEDETNGNGIVVIIEYGIKRGNKMETTTVSLKL